MITAKTFTELYPKIIKDVVNNGSPVKPRGKLVKELLCYQFCLEDPTQPVPLQKERGMNLPFSFIEALGLFRQQEVMREALLWYVPKLEDYMDEHPMVGPGCESDKHMVKEWDGYYGDRQTVYKQMDRCYRLLQNDPDSRRAVMAWFNPAWDKIDSESKDIPCTLTLQFLVREGKLHMIVHMRSNDILLGTPQNVFMNTFLQRLMACWLRIPVGHYFHRVNSMHAYMTDLPKLNAVADSETFIDHPFKVMGEYGMIRPDVLEESIDLMLKLDSISRFHKGRIEGTEGERLRAKLHIKLRKVYDEVLHPYYIKKNLPS